MKIAALLMSAVMITMISSDESHAAMLKKGKLSGNDDSYYDSYNYDEYYYDSDAPNTNRRILPRRGDIAVIVEGDNKQHVAMSEAMIISELINHGYRVVDEAKMRRIKMAAARAKAAQYAWEGNIAGLLKLNGSYSAAATILARVHAGMPEVNEIGAYTGTASIRILAVTSGGVKLGGEIAQGKAVGYTIEEARQNAINDSVSRGLAKIF